MARIIVKETKRDTFYNWKVLRNGKKVDSASTKTEALKMANWFREQEKLKRSRRR